MIIAQLFRIAITARRSENCSVWQRNIPVTSGSRGPHIQAAQDILNKCNIDVMYGKSNLAWARNWDHSEAYCKAIAETLEKAYAKNEKKGWRTP